MNRLCDRRAACCGGQRRVSGSQPGAQAIEHRCEGRDLTSAADVMQDHPGAPPVGRRVGPVFQVTAIQVGLLHQPELEVGTLGWWKKPHVVALSPVVRPEHAVVLEGANGRLHAGFVGLEQTRSLIALKPMGLRLGIVPVAGELEAGHALEIRPRLEGYNGGRRESCDQGDGRRRQHQGSAVPPEPAGNGLAPERLGGERKRAVGSPPVEVFRKLPGAVVPPVGLGIEATLQDRPQARRDRAACKRLCLANQSAAAGDTPGGEGTGGEIGETGARPASASCGVAAPNGGRPVSASSNTIPSA